MSGSGVLGVHCVHETLQRRGERAGSEAPSASTPPSCLTSMKAMVLPRGSHWLSQPYWFWVLTS